MTLCFPSNQRSVSDYSSESKAVGPPLYLQIIKIHQEFTF